MSFRNESDVRTQALENLAAVMNHIYAEAELLQRSFRLFEGKWIYKLNQSYEKTIVLKKFSIV